MFNAAPECRGGVVVDLPNTMFNAAPECRGGVVDLPNTMFNVAPECRGGLVVDLPKPCLMPHLNVGVVL